LKQIAIRFRNQKFQVQIPVVSWGFYDERLHLLTSHGWFYILFNHHHHQPINFPTVGDRPFLWITHKEKGPYIIIIIITYIMYYIVKGDKGTCETYVYNSETNAFDI
jgi:hypothetical protein